MSVPHVLLTGATGYLGHEVAAVLGQRKVAFTAIGRQRGFDLAHTFDLAPRLAAELERLPATAVPVLLHVAAMSRADDCERQPEVAFGVNAEASGALVSVMRRPEARSVYVSTDLVFDGEAAPYDEESEARPLSVYGRSKRAGEHYVLASSHGLVVRVPLLYGPSFDGRRGASDPVLAGLRAGREVRLFGDEWRTPLLVRTAAERLVDLALDAGVVGIRHLPGPERLSRLELGRRVAQEAGLPVELLVEAARGEHRGAPRARDCSLTTKARAALAAGQEPVAS